MALGILARQDIFTAGERTEVKIVLPGECDLFVRRRKLLFARESPSLYWWLDFALLRCLARYSIAASLLQLEHLNGPDCRHSLSSRVQELEQSALIFAAQRCANAHVPHDCPRDVR
jgi:hypothetical protein